MVSFAKQTFSYLRSGVSTLGALFPCVPETKGNKPRNVSQDFIEAGSDLWNALRIETGLRYASK
ncbi:MAG: hypothetical protein IK015_10475 [Treponema sp.]|nr:hypothetical protein [Treponema sp.]